MQTKMKARLQNQCQHQKSKVSSVQINDEVLHFWCKETTQSEYQLLFSYSMPTAQVILRGLNHRYLWCVKNNLGKVVFSSETKGV